MNNLFSPTPVCKKTAVTVWTPASWHVPDPPHQTNPASVTLDAPKALHRLPCSWTKICVTRSWHLTTSSKIHPSLISGYHDDIQENSFHKILNLPCGSAILTFTLMITNEVTANKLIGRWQNINQQPINKQQKSRVQQQCEHQPRVWQVLTLPSPFSYVTNTKVILPFEFCTNLANLFHGNFVNHTENSLCLRYDPQKTKETQRSWLLTFQNITLCYA